MKQLIENIQEVLKPYYTQSEIMGFIRIMLPFVFNLPYSSLILKKEDIFINDQQEQLIQSIVDRLKAFEPIQYIIGEEEFFGLPFIVDRNTLIPRPETEELVEHIIIDHKNDTPSVLDIGTGSGCIAIAIAKNLKNSKVWAWDFSNKALEIAKQNADKNCVDVSFAQVDVLANYPQSQKFDIIVSNPPYVLESEKNEMSENVLNYEPHSALFVADNEPLLFYERIADIGLEILNPSGKLYFEINRTKGLETIEMLHKKGFVDSSLIQDISGNDRIVKAQLP